MDNYADIVEGLGSPQQDGLLDEETTPTQQEVFAAVGERAAEQRGENAPLLEGLPGDQRPGDRDQSKPDVAGRAGESLQEDGGKSGVKFRLSASEGPQANPPAAYGEDGSPTLSKRICNEDAIMKKRGAATFLFLLLVANISLASEIISGRACYRFSDQESIQTARGIALSMAKRNALEGHAVFVRAASRVDNFSLKDDQIQTLAAGVLKNLRVTGKEEDLGRREICRAIAAEVDPEALEKTMLGMEEPKVPSDHAVALFREGLARANNPEGWKKAIKLFSEAIRIEPSSYAYFGRGWDFFKLKQHDRALSDFERGIELNPLDGGGFYGKGRVLLELEQYRRALHEFERALLLYSEQEHRLRAIYQMAYAHSLLGENEKALEYYSIFLQHYPKNRKALLFQHMIYLDLCNSGKGCRAWYQSCDGGGRGDGFPCPAP